MMEKFRANSLQLSAYSSCIYKAVKANEGCDMHKNTFNERHSLLWIWYLKVFFLFIAEDERNRGTNRKNDDRLKYYRGKLRNYTR